ncbi:MAG TPA: CoA transferase [Oligoflexus sp.]|uniref:CoA transferase n=1 Tax=Oligoflexus sp. TaxID=1971216 RepID=UPI002D7E41C2|nr:CoA transferase [Oligoflexus sp.]HET9240106.1 CoA transferase [Oligoflexus sp.]
MILTLLFSVLLCAGLALFFAWCRIQRELQRKVVQSQACFDDLMQGQSIASHSRVEFVAPPGHVRQLLLGCFQQNPFPRYRALLTVVRLMGVIKLFKRETVLQTPAAAAVLTASGVMATEIGHLRQQKPGPDQIVRGNVVLAGLQALRLYFASSFEPAFSLQRFRSCLEVNNAFNGSRQKYKTRDGRFFSFHCYYPEQKRKIVGALRLPQSHDQFTMQSVKEDRRLIEKTVARHDAADLEELSFASGACASILRTRAEWEASPVGKAVGKMPLIKMEARAHSQPPKKFSAPAPGQGPLAGIKVLDLTHIIAGPACTRLLAEYGADVLLIRRGQLRDQVQSFLELDGWAGKRVCHLDLNHEDERAYLRTLIREADIVICSYQQGALERFGLTEAAMFQLNPRLILGSLYCFSDTVWRSRPGWAPLAEDITGLSLRNGSAAKPRNLNGVPLDYIPGFVLTLGILQALYKTMTEGSGYVVDVSLTRVAMWLHACSDRFAELSVPQSLSGTRNQTVPPYLHFVAGTALGNLAFPAGAVVTPFDADAATSRPCVDGQWGWLEPAAADITDEAAIPVPAEALAYIPRPALNTIGTDGHP